jgi:hypothetical protein
VQLLSMFQLLLACIGSKLASCGCFTCCLCALAVCMRGVCPYRAWLLEWQDYCLFAYAQHWACLPRLVLAPIWGVALQLLSQLVACQAHLFHCRCFLGRVACVVCIDCVSARGSVSGGR